jgi:glyoxylase-like metal-dependent hydrolase (beta-lactamase superfamily II)
LAHWTIGNIARHAVGNATLLRVPYFDVALDAAVAGLDPEHVRSVEWAEPVWATSGQILIGQAVWVIECGDRLVVVDPCGAADEFIRSGPAAATHQEAVLGALAVAGLDPAGVSHVVLSHLDGIGMTALVDDHGAWVPTFPNARVVVTREELAWVRAHPETQGAVAFSALLDQGVVDPVTCPFRCTNEVAVELTGGHSAGHAVVRVESAGARALFVGHLALNPVQVAFPQGAGQHADADRAQQALDAILAEAVGDETLVIGPLWPAPGAARVSGPPWVMTPSSGGA